jgi:signal transduction histidine kinase/CheY-like chemotaxis protein
VKAPPTIRQVLVRSVAVQIGVLVLVVLLVVVAVSAYRVLAERVQERSAILVNLESVRTEILSAEGSLRGYALVRRDAFLDPYERAFPSLEAELAELGDSSLGDDPRLHQVDRLARAWRIRFAEPVLDALADGREERATALFQSGAGKARIDRIRELTGELTDEVNDQVLAQQRLSGVLGLLAVGAAATSIGAVLVLGYVLRRRLDDRLAVPMSDLAGAADRLGDGDLSVRARADGVAEVARMSVAFNGMAERMERTVTGLREVDRLKSEFVSVVSHELRTPLTSIRGSLGLLDSGAFGAMPDPATGMLKIAISNTDRLVRLINDILDLERIEAGVETLDLRPCSLGEVMEEAAAGIRHTFHEAGVDLVVRPVNAPLVADPDRIVQAITNLLGNAVKFSGRGGRVELEGTIRPGEAVLRVIDHGRGIPRDKLGTIFSRFQQVDASDAREKGGTGLGLAIVATIAEKHGGRVEVESELGRGSTFSLVLPLAGTADVRSGRWSRRGDREGPLVLVVEDDPDLAAVLQSTLERHGIGVVSAASAEDAIACGLEAVPDLLVLDVELSAGDGYEVVRQLRAHDRLRNVPTVVFTVHNLSQAERARLRLGDTVFLTKGPNPTADLEGEVLDLLELDRDVARER